METNIKTLEWKATRIPNEIETALAEAVDENGEIVNETALERVEALAQQRTVLISDLGAFVKEMRHVKIEHLDKVIAELKTKKARLEKAADICEAVIEKVLPVGEKVETDFVKLSWRKSESVEIAVTPEFLPDEFQRVKTTIEADKTGIKAALKAGRVVEGAKLVEKSHLQVK